MSLKFWSSGRLFLAAIGVAFAGLLLLWNSMVWMTTTTAPVLSWHDRGDASLASMKTDVDRVTASLPSVVLLGGTAYILLGVAFVLGLMSVARLAHEHALMRSAAKPVPGAFAGTGRPEDWKSPG